MHDTPHSYGRMTTRDITVGDIRKAKKYGRIREKRGHVTVRVITPEVVKGRSDLAPFLGLTVVLSGRYQGSSGRSRRGQTVVTAYYDERMRATAGGEVRADGGPA